MMERRLWARRSLNIIETRVTRRTASLFAFLVFVTLQCRFQQHTITEGKTTWLLIQSR